MSASNLLETSNYLSAGNDVHIDVTSKKGSGMKNAGGRTRSFAPQTNPSSTEGREYRRRDLIRGTNDLTEEEALAPAEEEQQQVAMICSGAGQTE